MATSVASGFNEYLNRLALTKIQAETAKSKASSISSFFRDNFEMAQPVFGVGSYYRNTIIRTERDIDLMALLSYTYYKDDYDNNSRDFLYMVRNALNDNYGSTQISSKRLAVKIDFSEIVVDVVPCFLRKGGGYLMPDGNNYWLATNPPYHATLMTNANISHNYRLKPLVKLMKEWNLANGHHLSSFHVELMVEHMWRDASFELYSHAVMSTLKAMPSWVQSTFIDPWLQSGQAVDSYLSYSERQLAIRLLNEDARNAELAEDHRANGRIEAAFERWAVIFRHRFPAYG